MKWKKTILLNVFYISLLTVIISLILPKTYTGYAVLMPPSTKTDVSILDAFSESVLPFGGLIPGYEDKSMKLIAILKSRKVMEAIINQYDLIDYYHLENIEEALESLSNHVSLEIEEEGTLSIKAYISTGWFHYEEDEIKARELSSKIANEFVNQLDIVNKQLQTEQASFQRAFIEERYNKNINDLQDAEERLKTFQEEHNTISLIEQTTAAIQVATELISRVSISKVKLGTLEETLPSDHPEIKLLKSEISGLNLQLIELDHGEKDTILIPGFSKVPNLSLALSRLIRDVEVQNKLYTYFTQQYEDAIIQEARNTPTIQLLDPAVPPIEKSSPKRFLMVIVMALITFIFTSMYALSLEYHRRIHNMS